MNLIESLKWRYATKQFSSKLVSEDFINKLIEVFNLTATSYGLQPLQLVVIHNKKLQKELVEHSFSQKQIEEASHVFVICIEKKIDTNYIERHFKHEQEVRGTKEEILIPFKDFLVEEFENKSKEEKEIWATKQAYIALGSLLSACALYEIDSCPMEGFVNEKYDKLLSLDDKDLQSVLVLPIGYRSKDDFFSSLKKVRRSTHNTVIKY